MITLRRFALLLALALLTASCASANPVAGEAADPAGFFYGLFHGATLPIALIVSLFSDTIGIYEVANTGAGYDIGFVIGVTVLGGGASARR